MDRAVILFEQSRYEQAAQELRLRLVDRPNDPVAHSLLALCLARGERYDEATREAQAAVHLAPDLGFAHYATASVLFDRDRLNEARTAIEEGIRLDPDEADHFALLSAIWLRKRRWTDALAAAEEGLGVDPEHVRCTNLRAMSLVKLGRKREAGTTIDSALAKDPENAVTHANQGWALLHQADYPKALVHFREALRLNPQLEWAREGIVEALKAQNVIYGLMLRYFLWMSRLDSRTQWVVVIGGFTGYRVLLGVARSSPEFAPLIWPVLVLYVAFALLTWIADPLFTLVLRFNRFGRLALSDEQVTSANWVGGCILAALTALAIWLVTSSSVALLTALVAGALAIPMAGTFRCAAGWPRRAMGAYTALVAAAALAGVSLSLAVPAVLDGGGDALFSLSLLGSMLSGWVANALAMASPKR